MISPLVIEVLYGSTPITKIWLLLPELLVYGCGALIARTLVRRRGQGWGALLVLGAAYALAEECVILQTSLQPLTFASYGRAAGVNWIYLMEVLVYEPVWAILIPVALVELLFPDRRDDPWIGNRGLLAACTLFLAGAVGAWYLWNTYGLQRLSPVSHYRTSALLPILALIAVAALVAVGLTVRIPPRPRGRRRAPRPWLLGLAAFSFALVWLAVLGGFAAGAYEAPVAAAIGFGIVWGGVALLLARRWSTADDFCDRHRMALIFGALVGSWLEGMVAVVDQGIITIATKLALDVAGVALLVVLARHVKRRRLGDPSPGEGLPIQSSQ